MVFSLLFWCLAAISNSLMDNLSHHWYKSIFNKRNENFWNPLVSCDTAKYLPFTKYKVDAWHLVKSLMIVFLALSVVTFKDVCYTEWYGYALIFIIYGLLWNCTFNLFYNHIFNR